MKLSGNKAVRAGTMGAALVLGLVACGSSGGGLSAKTAKNSEQPTKLTSFTSAVFQSELYLPDYVAKDKGFDRAHGLDMHFVTPQSGSAAAQLMLAGQVQGWFTDPLIVLTAASKGQDIKMAGLAVPTLQYWLLVSKDGNWPAESASFKEKMAALKGKNIGVSGIGAGTDHALLAGLASAGMSETDVHRVGIGQQQAAIGQLAAGRIDGFVSFSLAGNAVIEQQTGARLFVSFADQSVPSDVRNIPDGALAVSGAFAKSHPDVVANWKAAMEEAYGWIKTHQSEAAEILNEHVYKGAQPELAKKIIPQLLDGPFADVPVGFKVSRQSFDLGVSTLKKLGIISSSSSLAYDDVVIPSARADG